MSSDSRTKICTTTTFAFYIFIYILFLAGSLKEFGLMLQELSGEWKRTIERAELQLITPLEG